jgi:hypothetical protein
MLQRYGKKHEYRKPRAEIRVQHSKLAGTGGGLIFSIFFSLGKKTGIEGARLERFAVIPFFRDVSLPQNPAIRKLVFLMPVRLLLLKNPNLFALTQLFPTFTF